MLAVAKHCSQKLWKANQIQATEVAAKKESVRMFFWSRHGNVTPIYGFRIVESSDYEYEYY